MVVYDVKDLSETEPLEVHVGGSLSATTTPNFILISEKLVEL